MIIAKKFKNFQVNIFIIKKNQKAKYQNNIQGIK
jgi:hypothetical protein